MKEININLKVTKILNEDVFICNGVVVHSFIDGNYYVHPNEYHYNCATKDDFPDNEFKGAKYFEDILKLLKHLGKLTL